MWPLTSERLQSPKATTTEENVILNIHKDEQISDISEGHSAALSPILLGLVVLQTLL